jgi:D-lactate dehydrogenase (cytochrome)
VQAGVVNADLAAAAARHGLTYAPDPSSQTACTLGGNVAENSGGPHCLKYGVTTRYVTGLTVVGAGGEVLELRGATEAAGPDLVGLFVGSEGCFGLATEIELALVPEPEAVRTLLAAFPRPEEAGVAVSAIIAGGLLPAALEIVDGSTIRAVEASIFAAGYPIDAGAALVVEFDGAEVGLDDDLARAEALCRAAGSTEIRRARTAAERAALWKGRKKAFGAMGRLAPDLLVQDATVPRSRLPEVLRRVDEIARRHDLRVANVFHAGDGNLHPNLLFDRRDPDQVERVERASKEIMEACVAAGGTITGEHGVGLDKRAYMRLVFGPEELRAMAGVRRVFDPDGMWNPGKVLPDGIPSGEDGATPGEGAPRARRGASADEVAQALADDEGVEVFQGSAMLAGGAPLEGSWWRARAGMGRPLPPLALPADEAALAAVLRRSSSSGWRVLAAAGASALPDLDDVDLVVSTALMTAIESYRPEDLTVTAGAGVSLRTLDEALGAGGQWLPLDGPGLGPARLGGVVAAGDAAALATAFGGVRDLVLGLRATTADGRALALGGAVVKNVAGFDLVRLLVGSRGTLGVISSVTLRVYPRPAVDATLVLEAGRAEELVAAVGSVLTSALRPASIELGEADGAARLLVRVTGSEAETGYALAVFGDLLGAGHRLVVGAAAAELRESLRAAVTRAGTGARLVSRPSAEGLRELLARARRLPATPAGEGPPLRALPDRGTLEVGLTAPPPAAPAPGPSPGVKRLESGLRAVFDPRGTLVSPWGATW